MDPGDPPELFHSQNDRNKKSTQNTQLRKVVVGEGDLFGDIPSGHAPSGPSGTSSGMIMGPDHPAFQPPPPPAHPQNTTFPHGSIPPGARFDPVSPINPNPHEYRTGEPDFDELMPPGSMGDLDAPVRRSRPPGEGRNWFPPDGNPPPFGGAPFFG